MLKVDEAFKSWMRIRLNNKDYAERVMKAVTEIEDATLLDIWPHAALPKESEVKYDPEAMIGMLKGHDNQKDQDFIVAIFGEYEHIEPLLPYGWYIWSMYHPLTETNEGSLPCLYLIAFRSMEHDVAINQVRWRNRDGEEATMFGFDLHKINLINTRLESNVIRVITGAESSTEQKQSVD